MSLDADADPQPPAPHLTPLQRRALEVMWSNHVLDAGTALSPRDVRQLILDSGLNTFNFVQICEALHGMVDAGVAGCNNGTFLLYWAAVDPAEALAREIAGRLRDVDHPADVMVNALSRLLSPQVRARFMRDLGRDTGDPRTDALKDVFRRVLNSADMPPDDAITADIRHALHGDDDPAASA